MKQTFSPTQMHERIRLLDILRGFAIFGILMVNMMWYNSPIPSLISDNSLWTSESDKAARFLITFLFEGKFYVLFSMLFGYGFWLFLNKNNPEGRSILKLYSMRLFILLLIGIAHVLLLWPGDILIFYALIGFLLMLFRNVKNKTLLIWAVIFIMLPVLFMGFFVLINQIPEAKLAIEQAMIEQDKIFVALIEKALVVYQKGSFFEMMQMRIQEYSLALSGFLFFHVKIIAMFLIGTYAARKGYISDVKGNLSFFKKLCLWGFIIGIPTNLVASYIALHHDVYNPTGEAFLAMFLSSFGAPALTLAYVSGIAILLQQGYLIRMARWLAAVGRMALTNYLMHSIIASILFYGWGFGLYGKVNPWQGIILVFVIFSLQIPFSLYWLRKFRYGPFEWLWRSLTYMRLQKFRW